MPNKPYKTEADRLVHITIRIKPAVKAALEKLADEDERTLPDYLRRVLDRFALRHDLTLE